MREVEVGLRIDLKTGLSPFGTDEVNELIRRGGRVVALEPGGAIMRKLGEDAETYASPSADSVSRSGWRRHQTPNLALQRARPVAALSGNVNVKLGGPAR